MIDYGVGNLYSVQRALERCGATRVALSSNPVEIENADRVILPGVGAFSDGMQGLIERGLVEPICDYARSGRPLLGICLGMQMLASESQEFGRHAGLNLIPGRVIPIPRDGNHGERLKVPFIGWSSLQGRPEAFSRSCLKCMDDGQSVYLVHSFHLVPDQPGDLLATYRFGMHDVTAAVRRENITGLQFHPEKSGNIGLQVLATFVAGTGDRRLEDSDDLTGQGLD